MFTTVGSRVGRGRSRFNARYWKVGTQSTKTGLGAITMSGQSIILSPAGTISISGTFFGPVTDNVLALGSVAFNFSDLFLGNGAVINWNNSDVTVTHGTNALDIAGATTSIFGAADGQLMQNVAGAGVGIELAQICDFRCTLAASNFVYNPQPATPSSTDTGTEIVTFAAAHGWVTGTMVYVNTTAAGLTAATIYYINALSTTTCAFYTTLANAEANSSKVNLTGNVTAEVRPVGVQSTTLKFTPGSVGNRITMYDGTRWRMYTSAEMTLSLTATANTLYYIYCYSNSGTPTLEVSTTATTTQDGVLVKSGDATRKLVGLAWCVATNTFEDSGGAYVGAYPANRCVVSWYNRRPLHFRMCPGYLDDNSSTSVTTTSTTFTPINSGTNAQGLYVATGEDSAGFYLAGCVLNSGANTNRLGIGFDSTTGAIREAANAATGSIQSMIIDYSVIGTIGKHSINILVSVSAGTMTVTVDGNRVGGSYDPPITYLEGTVMG